MSSEPPPGSGQPPEDDPFRKRPGPGPGPDSPYDTPYGARQPPPHGGDPRGGDPYGGGGDPYGGGAGPYGGGGGYGAGGPYGGGGPADPLAGMPPLADSGRRTLARVIDMILVGVVVWLLTWALGVREYRMEGNGIEVGRSLAQSVVAAVLYVAYDTFTISRTGQTLGKKWLGMRVAMLDHGATPSARSALVRSLVLWLPFAFCCACVWTVICGGWSFFDKPFKQGLHDKAARTVVVSTR
ncbi:RDD family protein [Streptomyces sp. TG1A-8]|uniref:RDD family protein n=1 Tax=Streptomyces sp. TG1A-8 TaxID=3051385 RepID=UPI00265BA55C|nr:RDD family protein [Streptomyces sp. TG1A-8]MDO0927508.1 RDD family protein [Streptomyces sp. TG1A-8]